jgi:hypothetical protein
MAPSAEISQSIIRDTHSFLIQNLDLSTSMSFHKTCSCLNICENCIKKKKPVWPGKIAQLVKLLAAKPNHLCLIPGTSMVKEGPGFTQLSSDFHLHAMVCMQAHMHAHTSLMNL